MDPSSSLSLSRRPDIVAGQLRPPLLLLAEDPRIIRIVFYEDEESGEDEGETASAKEEDDVPGRGERRRRGRSKWVTVRESKGGRE